jgi:vacuolar-type H+-ATPase subunit H
MRPIWQCFGLRKPKVEIDEAGEECRKAFGIVCSFIGTRDLVQEHIAFRVWPLVEKWEMPKETISKSDEGGLVRLKYTFRYEGKFVEPDDDWLKCIEATSDKLLGPYSKAEDNALSAAFEGQKKKRLNRVFDAIRFMYPDYRYTSRGQKRKSATSGKDAAPAAPSEPAPKRKKVKVLTHRPRYIEPTVVPEFGGETSSATKAEESALTQRNEEPATMPKVNKIEEPRVEDKILVLSPSAEVTVPKAQKDLIATPKRKRMVNVLDVLETIKSSSSTLGKIVEALETRAETKLTEAEAAKSQAETEVGPSKPAKEKSLETGEEETNKEATKQILPEKTVSSTPEASFGVPDYIVRHASGKRLSEEEKREAQYYAQKLKYPKGALIFNGSGEEDFLYCLLDSKEISVCREMGKSFGFPTLEHGLSVLSKDELADSLAYNSLKV